MIHAAGNEGSVLKHIRLTVTASQSHVQAVIAAGADSSVAGKNTMKEIWEFGQMGKAKI